MTENLQNTKNNNDLFAKMKTAGHKNVIAHRVQEILDTIKTDPNIYFQVWYDIDDNSINISKYQDKIDMETELCYISKILDGISIEEYINTLFNAAIEVINLKV